MKLKIVDKKISKEELKEITEENFETMVKVDVDVKREILSIGGEWHSEGDELLVRGGSSRENIWGVNFYPWNAPDARIEYTSLINIKPTLGNKSMEIEDRGVRAKVQLVVEKLLLGVDEGM